MDLVLLTRGREGVHNPQNLEDFICTSHPSGSVKEKTRGFFSWFGRCGLSVVEVYAALRKENVSCGGEGAIQ